MVHRVDRTIDPPAGEHQRDDERGKPSTGTVKVIGAKNSTAPTISPAAPIQIRNAPGTKVSAAR
jgi:hypothetical protein